MALLESVGALLALELLQARMAYRSLEPDGVGGFAQELQNSFEGAGEVFVTHQMDGEIGFVEPSADVAGPIGEELR